MSGSGVVGGDEGRLHWLDGISARTIVTGSASGGRFSVVGHRLKARELAAPLHRHRREDELSVVPDGQSR